MDGRVQSASRRVLVAYAEAPIPLPWCPGRSCRSALSGPYPTRSFVVGPNWHWRRRQHDHDRWQNHEQITYGWRNTHARIIGRRPGSCRRGRRTRRGSRASRRRRRGCGRRRFGGAGQRGRARRRCCAAARARFRLWDTVASCGRRSRSPGLALPSPRAGHRPDLSRPSSRMTPLLTCTSGRRRCTALSRP